MRLIIAAMLAVVTAMVAGCSSPKRSDLVSTGRVKIDRVDSPDLVIYSPTITQSEGVVEFKGEVHRRPQFNGPPQGHIHIDLYDAKGEWQDQLAVGWQPNSIPTTGTRSASYLLQYYWLPAHGATVRVSIVDDEHLSALSRAGGSSSSGGGPAQSHGNAMPPVGGSPRTGATRTPGTPRQPSQPRTPGTGSGRGSSSGGRR